MLAVTASILSQHLNNPTSVPMNNFCKSDLEFRLKTFVSLSLQRSYSNTFDHESRLQLLSLAWEAQKLLWILR
ncbi:MAG: hypothetical protein F6K19_30755 [Cyanothece sp. SIO1E1]|nr:hypothetical protein [Cyanothece sp. SIO1E1]